MSTVITTKDVPKDAAERRHWVIYQLRRRGTSLHRIALKNGVSDQAVQNALMFPSSHLEREIAKALGLKARELFPERFDESGQRINQTRPQQRSTGSKRGNVYVGDAA
jgi:lambda repressor-like predicted transcriptional regulator